jgi:hypothetical protein
MLSRICGGCTSKAGFWDPVRYSYSGRAPAEAVEKVTVGYRCLKPCIRGGVFNDVVGENGSVQEMGWDDAPNSSEE